MYIYSLKKPPILKSAAFSVPLLNLGLDYEGCVTMNLNRHPHTLIAGETGSGKSTILKCLIYQCIAKHHQVKLIDFKRGVSFTVFDEVVDIYSDYAEIDIVLKNLVAETNRRLDVLRDSRVENIKEYSEIAKDKPMKRIVVFIDELAELMRASDKETNQSITNSLESLTRLSRAVGINLIMGIQRPDATIINGQIKNNIALRICGRFVDPEPSRIMLGNDKATSLPKICGRFIFKDDEYKEFQAFRITDDNMPFIQKKMYKAYIDNDDTESIAELEISANNNEPIQSEPNNKFDFGFDDIEV